MTVFYHGHTIIFYMPKNMIFQFECKQEGKKSSVIYDSLLSSFHNEEPSVISNGLCRPSFQNEAASLNHKLIHNKSENSHYEMTGIFYSALDSHPADTENDTHCKMTDRHSHKERSPCQSIGSSQIFVTRLLKIQQAHEIFLYQNYFFLFPRFW